MLAPILGSAVLGLVKGLLDDAVVTPSFEQDLWGPAKEELLYRGPLWAFPKLPYGSTAVLFAADHLMDDVKADAKDPEAGTPNAWEVVARFSDVFLGGCLYELAMRRHGILAAIAAHALHNSTYALGSRLRRRRG